MKIDESLNIKNLLQTEKQMFCMVCMKFLCNIHYYDEDRISFSSLGSFLIKPYLISYRRILSVLISKKSLLTEIVSFMIDEEIEKFKDLYKLKQYSKKFSFIKKLEEDEQIIENLLPCNELCYISNSAYKNITKDAVSNSFSSFEYEYISKLFEIFKFDSCKISDFLKKTLKKDFSCVSVSVAYLYLLDCSLSFSSERSFTYL